MKRSFTILIFILLNSSLFGQRTWIETQNLDIQPNLHTDSGSVGPIEMVVREDAKLWVLMQGNQDHTTWLYLIDSSGALLVNNKVANYGGHTHEDCFSLHTTKDSGAVYIKRYHNLGVYMIDSIFSIASDGSILWYRTYYSQGLAPLANSIVPTHYNTFLVSLTNDSLIELDDNGNYIRSRVPFYYRARITALADSTFIEQKDSTVTRQNFAGNIQWTLNAPGYILAYADLNFIYLLSLTGVMKINTLNGNLIWAKPIVTRSLSKTSDDGFLTLDNNQISKYDSAGLNQWNKSILFSQFDLKGVIEVGYKNYITGGSWQNKHIILQDLGYSPFLASLDSSGNGVIDSTDYYYIGNANDNNYLSFGDDAVYIAAAFNNNGPPRSNLLQENLLLSVFGTKWESEFCTGINHKYSDVDGNGIIDTADIRKISGSLIPRIVTTHWLRQADQSSVSSIIFSLENDTVSLMNPVKLHVILGSTLQPVDSIYGLSFDIWFGGMMINGAIISSYSINPTALGDTALNLYHHYAYHVSNPPISSMVFCRTDHLNANVAGDTIVTLNYLFPSGTQIIGPATMNIHYSAITECGNPINLDIVTDTLHLFNPVGISEITSQGIRIYPQPASEKVIFSLEEKIKELQITNSIGEIVLSVSNPESNNQFDVNDYPDGIYFVSAKSNTNNYKSKFIICK